MASETDDEEQKRLQLEEFQRQQAAKAIEASRGQPNAIPNEPVRAVDRTVSQIFTARGLPVPDTVIAPTPDIGRMPTPQQQKQLGIGNYIDKFGDPVGPVTDLSGYHLPKPEGAVGIQGVQSPQEEQFWAANPAGAVKDPHTGMLIGLGNGPAPKAITDEYARFGSGQGKPAGGDVVFNPRTGTWESQSGTQPYQRAPTIDDFIDPAIEARRGEIANERALVMDHLNTASKQRTGGGRHGGGGPSPWETEYAKLKALDHADSVLQKEQFGRAHLKAQIAGEEFKRQRGLDTASQTQAFYTAMSNVKSPIGTPEHAQEVMAIAAQLPLAANTSEIRQVLKEHADLHDSHAALLENARQSGATVRMTGIGPRGAQYKVEEAGAVPSQVQQRYIRLQADLKMHQEQADIEKQANIKGLKGKVPYTKAPLLHATQLEMQKLEDRYPSLKPQASTTPTAAPDTTTMRVRRPDGTVGRIPASQLQDALAQGYERVQ